MLFIFLNDYYVSPREMSTYFDPKILGLSHTPILEDVSC